MGSLVPYKVILSYNGSEFAGFQRQADARTVQGEFEAGLRQIGWRGKSILAAGRTDAGVHARGQVVSFNLDWAHSLDDLRDALNYYLPRDMAVRTVMKASQDFHPRFDAKERHYRYSLFCQPIRDPLREDFAWRVWPPLNLAQMLVSTKDLIGLHDFKAFGSPTTKGGETIREVFSVEWNQEGDAFTFDIVANAFLYHMVRRIVLALVKVGQGEAPETLIEESLQTGEFPFTGLAPAQGLVLEDVKYS
jgi:tRNA pseudouridine38-40 synthase